MIAFLYEITLSLLALLALPRLLLQMVLHGKYRKSFWEKLGLAGDIVHKTPQTPVVWVHAVSVGETKAVAPLARLIKEHFPQIILVISSGTETGHAEAKRSLPFANHFIFFPYDFRRSVKRSLKRIQPDLVILCETDYWYNFLRLAKAQGVHIAVVNGKISKRSLGRFLWVPSISKRLFGLIEFICAQNNLYQERFVALGVPSERLKVTGNLKFDEQIPRLSQEALSQWRERLGVAKTDLVLVIGSTHDPEEEEILKVLKQLWQEFPQLKVLLAPRHPERFAAVAKILKQDHIAFNLFSQIEKQAQTAQMTLIDTMGQLRTCYQLADVAIVGGSFVKHVGGHHILEPAGYGVPVIFGPSMHAQPDFLDLALAAKAGIQVPIEGLKQALEELLKDPEKRAWMGQNGLRLVEENRGAAERTFEALRTFYFDSLFSRLS